MQVWLTQRRADVILKISGPEGREVVLDAKRIPDAERLLNTALGWTGSDPPTSPRRARDGNDRPARPRPLPGQC